MMKKLFVLTVLLMLSGLLLSGCYSAASGNGYSVDTKNIFQNVVTLKFMSDIGLIKQTEGLVSPLVGFIRFLILILLFTIFFSGAELLKLGKNASIVIALVFALISAIFIPGTILLAAATSYATIISLVMLGIPVFIAISGYFLLKDHHWIRVALMGLLAVVVWEMGSVIRGLGSTISQESAAFAPIIQTVDTWNSYIFGLVIFLGCISLLSAFGKMGGASEYRPNWLGKLKDHLLQQVPGTDRHTELRQARRTETRELNDLITERQLESDLGEIITRAEPLGKDLTQIVKDKGVPDNKFIPVMVTHKNDLKNKWDNLKKDEQKWKRAERREVVQLKRLIDEMHKANVSEGTINNLEAQEKLVLNDFVTIEKLFGNIDILFNSLEQSCFELEKGLDYKSAKATVSKPLLIASLGGVKQAKVNNALTIGANSYNKFIDGLRYARTVEEDAMKKTAVLAKQIKDSWVLPAK